MNTYKYGQELPDEVVNQLDAYIERIKAIKWFKPQDKISKKKIEKQINLICKAFGVKASPEFRELKTIQDWKNAWDYTWDAAWDAAWDAVWSAALDDARKAARNATWNADWDAAWSTARDVAWSAVWDLAWNSTCDAAQDAACGAADLLALNLPEYKEKYPNGNFINLIELWEAGLYPVGVVKGKFIIYVPPSVLEQ